MKFVGTCCEYLTEKGCKKLEERLENIIKREYGSEAKNIVIENCGKINEKALSLSNRIREEKKKIENEIKNSLATCNGKKILKVMKDVFDYRSSLLGQINRDRKQLYTDKRQEIKKLTGQTMLVYAIAHRDEIDTVVPAYNNDSLLFKDLINSDEEMINEISKNTIDNLSENEKKPYISVIEEKIEDILRREEEKTIVLPSVLLNLLKEAKEIIKHGPSIPSVRGYSVAESVMKIFYQNECKRASKLSTALITGQLPKKIREIIKKEGVKKDMIEIKFGDYKITLKELEKNVFRNCLKSVILTKEFANNVVSAVLEAGCRKK